MSNNIEGSPKKDEVVETKADREAALELASKDSLLGRDAFTMQVISNKGRNPDGSPIKDLGNFLAIRREQLEKDREAVTIGPENLKNSMIEHSKKWEEKESHE